MLQRGECTDRKQILHVFRVTLLTRNQLPDDKTSLRVIQLMLFLILVRFHIFEMVHRLQELSIIIDAHQHAQSLASFFMHCYRVAFCLRGGSEVLF